MINEQIRDREVRVIGTDGQQLGVMSSRDAQKLADEAELDLIKISPKAKPPVCKIMDYGKFRYEQQKREKEAKTEVREMTIEDGAVVAEIEHQSFSDAWSEKAILETLEQNNSVCFVAEKAGKRGGWSCINANFEGVE